MRSREPRPAELVVRRLEGGREAWQALRERLNAASLVEARRLADAIVADLRADGWLGADKETR